MLSLSAAPVTSASAVNPAGAVGGSSTWNRAGAVSEWIGNHNIAPLSPHEHARLQCVNCEQVADPEWFKKHACESQYKYEKATPIPDQWAGAILRAQEFDEFVYANLPEPEPQVHSGPAAFLCGVGAGHVCGEPASRFSDLLRQMQELHDRKRNDYTGQSGDILHNYRNSAKLAGITTAQGMFARLCEKVVRISSVMSNGGATAVSDEKLNDTYFDLAVIALLSIIELEERSDQGRTRDSTAGSGTEQCGDCRCSGNDEG